VRSYELLNNPNKVLDLVRPINIFFNGPSNSYRELDLFDALNLNKTNDSLRDSIFLVGKESTSLNEIDTPMGKMSALEVQANILQTLLTERSVFLWPPVWKSLITLVSFIVTISLIFYFPLSLGSLFLIFWGSFLGIAGFAILIWLETWIGLANPLFSILSTHLIFVGYKINQQEEKQRRIQEESRLLREMDEFKNNFVSLFSHDLKTPIAKIKAVVDRVSKENPDLDTSVSEGLNTIERANEELSRLISDILRVTKMESMPIKASKEVVDLNRLVESAVQRLKVLADQKQLQIIQNLEPLFTTEGDPHLLLEVITNLLENAIKYSPPQSRVIVQTRESENQMSVHIFDEGPGIPEDELPRVTTKFYRGKIASASTKGTGLGLYLAKYFVELHRGKLELQSKVGVGTHVSFFLPIK